LGGGVESEAEGGIAGGAASLRAGEAAGDGGAQEASGAVEVHAIEAGAGVVEDEKVVGGITCLAHACAAADQAPAATLHARACVETIVLTQAHTVAVCEGEISLAAQAQILRGTGQAGVCEGRTAGLA